MKRLNKRTYPVISDNLTCKGNPMMIDYIQAKIENKTWDNYDTSIENTIAKGVDHYEKTY